jgi:hypothetical protein
VTISFCDFNYLCTADFESLGYYFFFRGQREGQFWGQKGRGPLEKPCEMPHYMFCPRQKIISRTFQIRGALVFLCPKEGEERREKKEERRETRDERRETRDKRREMRDECARE